VINVQANTSGLGSNRRTIPVIESGDINIQNSIFYQIYTLENKNIENNFILGTLSVTISKTTIDSNIPQNQFGRISSLRLIISESTISNRQFRCLFEGYSLVSIIQSHIMNAGMTYLIYFYINSLFLLTISYLVITILGYGVKGICNTIQSITGNVEIRNSIIVSSGIPEQTSFLSSKAQIIITNSVLSFGSNSFDVLFNSTSSILISNSSISDVIGSLFTADNISIIQNSHISNFVSNEKMDAIIGKEINIYNSNFTKISIKSYCLLNGDKKEIRDSYFCSSSICLDTDTSLIGNCNSTLQPTTPTISPTTSPTSIPTSPTIHPTSQPTSPTITSPTSKTPTTVGPCLKTVWKNEDCSLSILTILIIVASSIVFIFILILSIWKIISIIRSKKKKGNYLIDGYLDDDSRSLLHRIDERNSEEGMNSSI
jgi:hypothetical protein